MTTRRITISAWGMLCVPRRDPLSLLRGALTGDRRTFDAAYSGIMLVELPAGAPIPSAHLDVDVRGNPVVWTDAEQAIVLRREIKELPFR